MEKINYLIKYLLDERGENLQGYNEVDKKSLYRALVNIRDALPISEDFLKPEMWIHVKYLKLFL